jgi:hypothetical protein
MNQFYNKISNPSNTNPLSILPPPAQRPKSNCAFLKLIRSTVVGSNGKRTLHLQWDRTRVPMWTKISPVPIDILSHYFIPKTQDIENKYILLKRISPIFFILFSKVLNNNYVITLKLLYL